MKWLFALLLALAIFGGAAYFAYNVLFKQEIAVQKEQRGEIPATPAARSEPAGISGGGEITAGR